MHHIRLSSYTTCQLEPHPSEAGAFSFLIGFYVKFLGDEAQKKRILASTTPDFKTFFRR